MIKVLSIIPYKIFPAKVGGQKGIALFTSYFAAECEVVAVTVKSNDPVFAKNYKVENILTDSSFRYADLFYFFQLKKMIREQQITHLLLEHPYFGWLGMWLKWSTGVKLVVHSHNIESTRWKSLGKWWWRILWLYERMTHRRADYNFFIHDDDRLYAINRFKLDAGKCITATYGIDWSRSPSSEEKKYCRKKLEQQHGILPDEKVFLFNGALDYKPNADAVRSIVDFINPILLQKKLHYKIIICGRGLPSEWKLLIDYADKNIIYAGFVDDITVYFKGADIFINPVVEGGGIKTKLVEALGYNTMAISTQNGSIGVTPDDAGEMLKIVRDHDWQTFADVMAFRSPKTVANIPATFYQKFYWGNIAKKAAQFISGQEDL